MILEEKLAKLSGVSLNGILEILQNVEGEYNCYYIKKKSGGRRQICAPSERLKSLQSAVCRVVLSGFKVSKYSTAYERGCSVKKNVTAHRKARHVYKADIANFFPSIDREMVKKLLKKRYSESEIDTLWKLCSFRGGLPIGSPASPMLANRVMLSVDKQLAKAAKGCRFTRYADDMTFSSKKYIDKRIEKSADEILRKAGFKTNPKKCKFFSLAGGIHITGLVVTHEHKVSVGSKYKRKLKKLWHNLRVRKIGNRQKLTGKQAFADFIQSDGV